jgi:hypothetical protein
MKKTILLAAALSLAPLAARAQTPAQGTPPAPGAKAVQGPGAKNGHGPGDPERMEKRMRLARTLGLAEALDLDSAQALKLGDEISKFDDRRLAAHKQLRDANQVLRAAARGDKAEAAAVDQAIQKALDARAQIQAVDREVVATVTKGLTPDKKARAVLFLAKFQGRFGPGPGMMRGGPGMHRGMGPGNGMGSGRGMGMGPGAMGMGPGPGAGPMASGGWDDEDLDD